MKGLNMSRFIMILLAASIVSMTAQCSNNDDVSKLAYDLKDAVLEEKRERLLEFVAPQGTNSIDSSYTKKQVVELMNDHNSWLFKYLFLDDKSVKNYFKEAKDLKVKVYTRSNESTFVSYQTSNHKPTEWVECCLIKINGKWYFDGIFECN